MLWYSSYCKHPLWRKSIALKWKSEKVSTRRMRVRSWHTITASVQLCWFCVIIFWNLTAITDHYRWVVNKSHHWFYNLAHFGFSNSNGQMQVLYTYAANKSTFLWWAIHIVTFLWQNNTWNSQLQIFIALQYPFLCRIGIYKRTLVSWQTFYMYALAFFWPVFASLF